MASIGLQRWNPLAEQGTEVGWQHHRRHHAGTQVHHLRHRAVALEAGLDPNVWSPRTRNAINRGGEHQHGVDYSGGAPASTSTDKIAKAMESERKINESKSKVRFDTSRPRFGHGFVPPGTAAPQTPTRSPYPPSMTSWPRPASSRSPMAAVPPAVRQSRNPPSRRSPPNGRCSIRIPRTQPHGGDRLSLDPGLLRGTSGIFGHRGCQQFGLTDEEGQNLLLVEGSSYRPA